MKSAFLAGSMEELLKGVSGGLGGRGGRGRKKGGKKALKQSQTITLGVGQYHIGANIRKYLIFFGTGVSRHSDGFVGTTILPIIF